MRSTVILLIFVLLSVGVQSQGIYSPDTSKKFSVNQLIADFTLFRSILEKAHPSLYRYTPKDSIELYFKRALKELNHPMTEIQFWTLLNVVTSQIRSGHTMVLLSDSSVGKFDKELHTILPFHIFIKDNRLFIKEFIGKPDTALNFGDEIVKIDGESSKQLLADDYSLLNGDGYMLSYKNHLLINGEFNRLYELKHPGRIFFNLVVRGTDGKEKLLSVKAAVASYRGGRQSSEKIQNLSRQSGHGVSVTRIGIDSLLHSVIYPVDLSHSAILKISSFTYMDFVSFHKRLFADLAKKNITNLIIDIRDNSGGDDRICIDLLKYLIKDNFYFARRDEAVVDLNQFSSVISKVTKTENGKFKELTSRRYTLMLPANQPQQGHTIVYKGNVHILMNGGTFSAATLFAVALKAQLSCHTYGTETGGGEAGCDGGSIDTIVLPQTSLRLVLPLLWTYSAKIEENLGKGLSPDHPFAEFWLDRDLILLKYLIKSNSSGSGISN